MNNKTFNSKEFIFFSIPVMVIDTIIHILAFEAELQWFMFWDPLDLILTRPRTLYFLIVSYLIAVSIVPVSFFKRGRNFKFLVKNALYQTGLTIFFLSLSVFILFDSFAGRFFLQQGILSATAIILWHAVFKLIIVIARGKGRNKQHVVIVGNGDNASSLYKAMTGDKKEYNDYKFLGFFSDNKSDIPDSAKYLGRISDIDNYLACNKVHLVFCSINPANNAETVNKIIRQCENLFIEFYYVPNMDGYLNRKMVFSEIGGTTIVKLREEPLSNPVNYMIKRAFDLLISSLFLITIFPVIYIAVAIGIKLSSPGPVLFRQHRTGYKGKPFTMLKFRSMKVNADADRLQATSSDPRKTPFGDFLRRTSIDELPQFINVLLGDMSIIGPRPHMELHTEIYNNLIDEYMVRHMVKPGLTGWAQIHGCRGETKDVQQMENRVKHDIWYIENWSVLLDLKIFVLTIFQILKGDKQAY